MTATSIGGSFENVTGTNGFPRCVYAARTFDVCTVMYLESTRLEGARSILQPDTHRFRSIFNGNCGGISFYIEGKVGPLDLRGARKFREKKRGFTTVRVSGHLRDRGAKREEEKGNICWLGSPFVYSSGLRTIPE